MNDNMRRLRELSEKLGPMPGESCGAETTPAVAAGDAKGTCVFVEPNVSVLVWSISGGTDYQAHKHAEAEWVVVYRGEARIGAEMDLGNRLARDENGRYILKVGDFLYIPANVAHEGFFPENTEAITVHVPRSTDYTP